MKDKSRLYIAPKTAVYALNGVTRLCSGSGGKFLNSDGTKGNLDLNAVESGVNASEAAARRFYDEDEPERDW